MRLIALLLNLICFLIPRLLLAAGEAPSTLTSSPTPGGLTQQLPVASATRGSSTEAPGEHPTPSTAVENSVVKVFSSMRAPDLYRPWAKQAPTEVTGSGVVIEG